MGGIMMPYMGDMGQQGYVAPNQIANLSIWYNASQSTTTVNGVVTNNFQAAVVNGSSTSAWTDLSGAGHPANVNGGVGKSPTYTIPIQNSLGAVTFASVNSNNLDVNPIAWAQSLPGFTIYVLARPTSLPATAFPLTVTDQSLGMWWNGTNWSAGAASGVGTVSVTNDTTKFHIYGMVFNGAATGNANRLAFRYDKSATTLNFGATTVGTATGASAATFYFGGANRNGSPLTGTFMNGYIGEVLIWTRALSTSEQSSVELYLNTKWGLGLV